MPEGSRAQYHDSSLETIGTSIAAQTFATELSNLDSIVTVDGDDDLWTVNEAGNYFVGYEIQAEDDATSPRRAEVVSRFQTNGITRTYGRSQGFWRNAQNTGQCSLNAGVVWDFALNDTVEIMAGRSDSNTAAQANTRRTNRGQLFFWRMPDHWPIMRARRTTNGTATTSSDAAITWEQAQRVQGDWNVSGDTITFEPDTDGEYVFLVCASSEVESSSTTDRGVYELSLQYDDDVIGAARDVCRVTSYVRGLDGCTTGVGSLFTLIESSNDNNFQFQLLQRHQGSAGVTFTPQGDKVGISAVAIPKDEFHGFFVREDAGGQAADADAAVEFDTTDHEDASYDHDTVSDDTLVTTQQAVGTIVFGQMFAEATAARTTTSRLLHQLSIRDNGSELVRGNAKAYNRGDTGCEEAGVCVFSYIPSFPSGQTLDLYHDNESTASDSAVDFAGGYVTRLSGLRIEQRQGVDEDLHLDEELGAAQTLHRAVDEAEHVLEEAARAAGISTDDAVHVIEEAVRVIGFAQAVEDAVWLVENVPRVLGFARAIDSAEHLDEAVAEQLGFVVSVDETLALIEEALTAVERAALADLRGASARGGSAAGGNGRGGSQRGTDARSHRG